GNIIKGLRLIDDTEWTVWFEEVSHIDRLLRERTDFEKLDFASRDAYRSAVEKLAKRSAREEHEVALQAVVMAETARECRSNGGTGVDAGCFLVGPRRQEFERALDYSPSFGERLYRIYRRSDWLGVVLPVALVTCMLLAAAAVALADYGLPTGAVVLLIALFAFPASEAAVGLFNTLVSTFVQPTRLNGYDYKDGVPARARTLVVAPVLFGSRDDVEDAVRNLEVHYLANMSGELHFAVLSDWSDSQTEQNAADLALLEHARELIAALNARYPKDGHARFYLLHRRRLYNKAESCWMGWERKRGKLHELNTLLRGDHDTTFFAPAEPLPQDIEYVMTVDADTRMTRGAVGKLVGKLEHPLNRPVIDAKARRLTSG